MKVKNRMVFSLSAAYPHSHLVDQKPRLIAMALTSGEKTRPPITSPEKDQSLKYVFY